MTAREREVLGNLAECEVGTGMCSLSRGDAIIAVRMTGRGWVNRIESCGIKVFIATKRGRKAFKKEFVK